MWNPHVAHRTTNLQPRIPPRAGIKGTNVGPAAYSTTVWPSATAPRGQKDSFWNEGGLKLDLLICSSLQILVH